MVCLTFNGEVFTCGEKFFIGHGKLDSYLNIPKKLTNIGKVGSISCGRQHTVLVSTDGNTLWSFGNNSLGELGHNGNPLEPTVIESMSNKQIVKVACGYTSSFALTKSGKLIYWGSFSSIEERNILPREVQAGMILIFLQLSPILTDNSIPFQKSKKNNKVIDISIKDRHILALTESNKLFSWGSNRGVITAEFIEKPKRIKGLEGLTIRQISAGDDHSLIICTKR